MTARWLQDVPAEEWWPVPGAQRRAGGDGMNRHIDATEPQDGRQERPGRGALPSALASLDARLCAWIVGLTVAALLCLFFGDALAGWAGVR